MNVFLTGLRSGPAVGFGGVTHGLLRSSVRTSAISLALGLALSGSACLAWAQTGTPAPGPAIPTRAGTAAPAPRAKKTTRPAAPSSVPANAPARQTIPIETAPPTGPGTPLTTTQQKNADARLLQRQEAESDKAGAVNDQQAQRAQQRQDTLQNQQRIQDAPGLPETQQPAPTTTAQPIPPLQTVDPSQLPQPGQTVVPAPGAPIAPR